MDCWNWELWSLFYDYFDIGLHFIISQLLTKKKSSLIRPQETNWYLNKLWLYQKHDYVKSSNSWIMNKGFLADNKFIFFNQSIKNEVKIIIILGEKSTFKPSYFVDFSRKKFN